MYKSFETKRLILKPTAIDDAAFILELLNMPKWLKYIGDRNIHTLEDAKNYITEKIMPQFEQLGFGNYTVFLKESNTKIGSCGIYNRKGVDGVDVGFAFLPKYEKQGFAFESAQKLIEVAFQEFKITQMYGVTTLRNKTSQHLLEKLGLQFEKMVAIPNKAEKMMLYSRFINK